ncbi:protocatechuate 3,4-dioxygenase subunit alpha [Sulfitobacter sp. S190]|uniref:protocatechuate 3,4-dioxygenase subunit alpha n=1 Tax=Sulfitobacter sp. S190 TaxID=2867022 RepID=UPI0021A3EBFF|nr:protocatechuate 3,4-dioxygenase subunit alpha [Sulfitobacter sp. S190]UWR21102.1 protocatechuate 3,4-dioxygenase subunit alpha [Sulfitobacter sp. S190]
MSDLPETASQTAGPYVHIGCTPNAAGLTGVYPEDMGARMITAQATGPRIALTGLILDGDGAPMGDAMIEAWHPDAAGRFAGDPLADPHATGFGRAATDATGRYRFETIKPGAIALPAGGMQAAHITLWIVARGINIGLHTRAYFADDPALGADPVLSGIKDRDRVGTLLAHPDGGGTYRFDIRVQGADETVFFDA